MLMPMSDGEVESILGPMLGSWEPLPLKEIIKSANPLTTSTNGCLSSLLSLSAFLLVVTAAVAAGVYFRSAPAGFLVAFGLAVPIGILATRFVEAAHRKTRLGVFERRIRFGRSIIRFDELKVVTFGAPKTFAERRMPTLRRGQKALEKAPAREASQRAENSRRFALTFVLNNGQNVVWLSFHAIYSRESMTVFELLDERIPEQLRGLALTEEERLRINAL